MIRFYNGRALSFGGGIKVTDDEVWTDGNRIVYVGPRKDEMPVFERQIDLKGDLVMPGLKDAHTHSPMTLLRSYAEDLPLQEWLFDKILPAEAKLNDDIVHWSAKLAIMEYLTSGITSAFDLYCYTDTYVKANIESGFRTVICSAMNDYDRDETDIERCFLQYNGYHELISYRLGIHAEYTTHGKRLEYMAGLLEKYKAPCFLHLSETKAEVEGCIERYGMTPPRFMDSLGYFNYGGGGFHCVWMSDEDIELFARKKLWAITNPCSNLKLASGICPVDRLLDAGIPMAIGTDGSSSNNALDMFREMYLASVLQKYSRDDAAAGQAGRILEMACVGGARCMGLDDCDDLAVGKKADLIVIDMHRPSMQPMNNIPCNLVYSGSKDCVRMTMVNGRVLYENGEFFIGEDPERIYKELNTFMARLRAQG